MVLLPPPSRQLWALVITLYRTGTPCKGKFTRPVDRIAICICKLLDEVKKMWWLHIRWKIVRNIESPRSRDQDPLHFDHYIGEDFGGRPKFNSSDAIATTSRSRLAFFNSYIYFNVCVLNWGVCLCINWTAKIQRSILWHGGQFENVPNDYLNRKLCKEEVHLT